MMTSKIKYLSIITLTASLVACSSNSVKLSSEVPLPDAFEKTYGDGTVQSLDRWWRYWNDPVLTQLIETALKNNKQLASTKANLENARSQARLVNANKGPIVGLKAGASGHLADLSNPLKSTSNRIKDKDSITSNLPIQPPKIDTPLSDDRLTPQGHIFDTGVVASWEPDFFGRKRSDADAAKYGALARQEQWHGAQMLLASDMANYYSQWQYYIEKKRLLEQEIQTLQTLRKYVLGRFKAGQATTYNINEIDGKLQALQAQNMTSQVQIDRAKRQIAILLGQTPQSFKLNPPTHQLGSNLPNPPSGQTPANVLNRRPDIRAQQALVYSASAQLASAKADLLPRFSINFLGQTGEVRLDSDLQDGSSIGSLISVGVHLPIFTAGRIKANIEAKDAQLKSYLNEYDAKVLNALGEVDNTYQAQYAITQQEKQLQTSIKTTQKQQYAAKRLFELGEKTLDESLQVEFNVHTLQDKALDASLAKVQNMLNLYKALGGGWQEAEKQP